MPPYHLYEEHTCDPNREGYTYWVLFIHVVCLKDHTNTTEQIPMKLGGRTHQGGTHYIGCGSRSWGRSGHSLHPCEWYHMLSHPYTPAGCPGIIVKTYKSACTEAASLQVYTCLFCAFTLKRVSGSSGAPGPAFSQEKLCVLCCVQRRSHLMLSCQVSRCSPQTRWLQRQRRPSRPVRKLCDASVGSVVTTPKAPPLT